MESKGRPLSKRERERGVREREREREREHQMETTLLFQVQHYIQAIQDLKGAPTDLRKLTQTSVSNNIAAILFGRRFDYNDPQFNRYMDAWEEMVQALGGKDRGVN